MVLNSRLSRRPNEGCICDAKSAAAYQQRPFCFNQWIWNEPIRIALVTQILMPSLNPLPEQARKRLLLLEDHPLNRSLFAEYLGHHGFHVHAIADGAHLFETLEQFQPQIIILDLKLPYIDGFTLLQQIRQSVRWQHLPVLVVSALSFSTDRQRAMNLGACDYFVKPVDLRLLLETINQHC